MIDNARSVWLPAGEPFPAPRAEPAKITSIVIHYIGTTSAPRDSKRWMLQTHRETMSRPEPYPHMYNFHVGVDGQTWEGRGLTFRNAANKATNPTSYSIVFGVDGQLPASTAQINGCRRLVRGIRQHVGRNIGLVAHRDIGSTTCPGAGITAQIRAGIFEENPNVTRIAGSNRFETAALISQRVYPKGSLVVYIASGRDFADALSASMFDGPVLLTEPTVLPAATRREIQRLKPSQIVIVGGTNAVSMHVESALMGLVA
jgi:hypothetical protein